MTDDLFSNSQLLALRAARLRREFRGREPLMDLPGACKPSEPKDLVERFAKSPEIRELCALLDLVEIGQAWCELSKTLAAQTFGIENSVEQVLLAARRFASAQTLRELLDPVEVDQMLADIVEAQSNGITNHCERFEACLRRAFSGSFESLGIRPLESFQILSLMLAHNSP